VIQVHVGRSTAVRLYSLNDVADMLNVHTGWVRTHLEEFPGRLKLPGGDYRIPIGDIESALDRWRGTIPEAALKRLELEREGSDA
jgi:hypothetical protein